jgi:S1-C subfamily serine protease
MTTFVVCLLICLSTVLAAQKGSVQRRAQPQTMSARQLHQLAISRTVWVVTTAFVGSGVWVSKDGYVATCWHVVKNTSEIKVEIAYPGVYNLEKHILVDASFAVYAATVVASDQNADVAILKVFPNPFATPPAAQRIINGEPEIKLASADLRTKLPAPGDFALLAGYPLGRPDLLTQTGTVAAVALVNDFQEPEASKGVRIILSLVSNPANSGGPVFDAKGKVLGILEGNFPSPVKDEAQRYALYVRPVRDANGNPILDANGKTQFETAQMYQNSGISVVVPAQFVQDALDQARGKTSSAQTTGSVVVRGVEVISTVPDTEPKVASSLSNLELKRQAASFLARFRTFLGQQEALEQQLWQGVAPAATREEREATWLRLSQKSSALQEEMRQEYQTMFKSEAKRLRDDFWARLPIAVRDTRSVRLYDYGFDLVELRNLGDDLERLSKTLPD